jgi:hypothetical protein
MGARGAGGTDHRDLNPGATRAGPLPHGLRTRNSLQCIQVVRRHHNGWPNAAEAIAN